MSFGESEQSGTKTNNSDKEGSWCDVHRRVCPWLAGRSDTEVVLRVYRAWWYQSPKDESYREKLHRGCTTTLIMLGGGNLKTPSEIAEARSHAESMASLIFESVPTFSMALDDIRYGGARAGALASNPF